MSRAAHLMDEQDRQLALRYFKAQNPNPDRARCPPKEVLKSVAAGTLDPTSDWYTHLTTCAACVSEAEHLRAARRRQQLLQLTGIAACLLAALLSLVWWSRALVPARGGEVAQTPPPAAPNAAPTPARPPAPDNPSPPAPARAEREPRALPAITLDLTAFAPFRGPDDASTPPIPQLRLERNDLVIILPPASPIGRYSAHLVDQTLRIVLTLPDARATRDASGRTVLRIEDCDFRGLAPGTYSLGLQADGQGWRLFPIAINT